MCVQYITSSLPHFTKNKHYWFACCFSEFRQIPVILAIAWPDPFCESRADYWPVVQNCFWQSCICDFLFFFFLWVENQSEISKSNFLKDSLDVFGNTNTLITNQGQEMLFCGFFWLTIDKQNAFVCVCLMQSHNFFFPTKLCFKCAKFRQCLKTLFHQRMDFPCHHLLSPAAHLWSVSFSTSLNVWWLWRESEFRDLLTFLKKFNLNIWGTWWNSIHLWSLWSPPWIKERPTQARTHAPPLPWCDPLASSFIIKEPFFLTFSSTLFMTAWINLIYSAH